MRYFLNVIHNIAFLWITSIIAINGLILFYSVWESGQYWQNL